MRIPVRFSIWLAVAVALSLGLAAPVATLAAGGATKPAASPKPDIQKKVWTNDEVERLNPAFAPNQPARQMALPVLASPAGIPKISVGPSTPRTVAPLPPEQDPAWYAQQLTSLQSELAGIESREGQLRQFRATAAGLPTGLVLNAPCEGITTDNLIAQLDARRKDILQQIDSLGDAARRNGLPPGILVEGRGLVQVASQPTADEQRAALTRQLQDASNQLAEIQRVVAGMRDQASAQGITLLQPTPGEGGSMTTDLLDRLGGRADALRGKISNAEDAARGMGVAPGELR